MSSREPQQSGDEAYRLLVQGIQGCGVYLLDPQGCVLLCNEEGARILAPGGESVIGQPLSCIFCEPLEPPLLDRAQQQSFVQEERWCQPPLGARLWARIFLTVLKASSGVLQGFAVVLRDATAEKRAAQRLLAHHAVTGILAEAPGLPEAMPRLLQAICDNLEWEVGILWGIDAEAGVLRCLEVWHQPGVDAGTFQERSRQLAVPRGAGLPGRVWAAGRPLWVSNVIADSQFLRTRAAVQEHLHGALGFPILLGSEPLGVLEVFSQQVREPDEAILAMMATIGSQIGQFMKRKQVEHDLRESEERYRLIADNAGAGVVMIDESSTILYMNAAGEKIFGYSAEEMEEKSLTLLMPERMRQQHLQGIARYLATRQRHIPWEAMEMPGLHRSGCEIPLEMTLGNFTTREGKQRFVCLVQDLSERRHAQTQLQQALQELHALTAHLQSVREDERTRIAREIHDELGQALTGLKLDLGWIERRLAETPEVQTSRPLAERMAVMSALIDSTIQTVRRIATELRPGVLDGLGLVAALRWLADDFTSRSGCLCTFSTTHDELATEPQRATALFRIAQESLTNVARHAQASRVSLRLNAEADSLMLEVEDNGKGLPPNGLGGQGRSLGLLGMKERALSLGGEVALAPAPGGGVLVRARIPTQT